MSDRGRYYGSRPTALSPREAEIVGALCMGETQPEIAERLCISRKTVEAHLQSAKKRRQARTLEALVYDYATTQKEAP